MGLLQLVQTAFDAIKNIKNKIVTPDRTETNGFSSKSGSALRLDKNGNIISISNESNQQIYNNESSSATDISYEKNIFANRVNETVDDHVFNGSKLNPQIYDMSGFVQQSEQCVQGHINFAGTVLVRMFEPNLNEWVFIRRYIRAPIFFPIMTTPLIDERFDISGLQGDNTIL